MGLAWAKVGECRRYFIFAELVAINRVPKFRPRSCRRECFRLFGEYRASSFLESRCSEVSSKENNTATRIYDSVAYASTD